ncbi:hypothetical protein EZV62_012215 [Acer yangbiense]|uniref:CCHC-type domain-containing protein n=1 Tax=Acer yangbiense TaxID=1000413 RepID=A0A5C7HXG7_9ROSI|nr:hypothetical protein EZV62_012215 [Acer yangbiense]
MNIDSKIGSTSKSNYDLNTTNSSQWEYTNNPHDKYMYCGHSYNTADQEAAVDPSFLTDHTPSAQHLCTPDNTTSLEVEPSLSELDDPAKLTSLQPSDVIGKEFASVQDAEAFYKNYSLFVGFSIRKDEMRRDRYGMITIRRWVCSKQGYREQKYMDKTNKKREPRGQTREGCRAAMKIKIERNSMMWVVSEFVIEHTHNLSPPNHIQFLRSHRSVKDSEIAQLQSWRTVGVKTAQVMDQSSSYSNVGHTKKDLQNRLDSVRSKKPKSVVIDGGKAMHKAIKIVMPESVRRLYCWHLERNVQTNVHDGNFTRAFCNYMMNFITEDEFDLQWFSMVEKFGLNNNEWVSAMLKMYEFLKNIDRALDRISNIETFNDYQCSTTTPVYGTHLLGLEKHAGQMYTRNVFFLVREEIRQEASLSIVNCVQDVDNYMYTFKKFGNENLRMQDLMPSSPINSQNVSGVQHVHNVKDPSMAATKGLVRRKKNAGVKQRKCGKCGQPGHTAKTCHGNVRTNNSSVSTNAVHM